MKVKTDTKERFHVITVPGDPISADMAAELGELLLHHLQNDVKNIILNLKELTHIDEIMAEMLVNTSQKFYESGSSFLICELQKPVEEWLDHNDKLELLNVVPTLSEASDIVKMEEIERELFDE